MYLMNFSFFHLIFIKCNVFKLMWSSLCSCRVKSIAEFKYVEMLFFDDLPLNSFELSLNQTELYFCGNKPELVDIYF